MSVGFMPLRLCVGKFWSQCTILKYICCLARGRSRAGVERLNGDLHSQGRLLFRIWAETRECIKVNDPYIRIFIFIYLYTYIPGADKSLAATRKETSSEAYKGRARFQQHRDASCHQDILFLQGKAPKEIDAIPTETLACFSFLVELRTYQHPYIYIYIYMCVCVCVCVCVKEKERTRSW